MPDVRNEGQWSRPAAFLSASLFVALLAGQFTFARLGMDNPLLIPERLAAAIVLAWLCLAMGGVRGAQLTSHVRARTPWALAPLFVLILAGSWSPPAAELASVWVDLACMVLYSISFVVLLKWDFTTVIATLMWFLWVTGGIFAVAGLAGSGDGRVSAFGGGPNVYSRVTDLGLVGLAWLISTRRVPTWTLASAPLLVAATVASGSRGGMLAGILCILVLLPLVTKLSKGKLLVSAAVALVGGAAVFRRYGDLVTETAQGRVVELTLERGYTSGRGGLLSVARDMFVESPVIGQGLRGFEVAYGNGFTYPHNLLAQVAAEAGIVGLLPLVVFLSMVLATAWRYLRWNAVRCLTAAFVVILTSSMFSGDYYDARFLWIFGLGVLGAAWHSRTEVHSPPGASGIAGSHVDVGHA